VVTQVREDVWQTCLCASVRYKSHEGVFDQAMGSSVSGTTAMRTHIETLMVLLCRLARGIKTVLHDRPPPHFKRTDSMHIHELYHRLGPLLAPALPTTFAPKSATSFAESMFTRVSGANSFPTLAEDRPALVVSSTSWTADEDFSVLIEALDYYNDAVARDTLKLPRLVVLISGKGPLRSSFESIVQSREECGRWRYVLVRCLWLTTQDYPTFLGSADLGVSLHQSSSGLDLPMKVVDMFGCGVPVLARDFAW
jgi:beta-1,4-mannosyltransferase